MHTRKRSNEGEGQSLSCDSSVVPRTLRVVTDGNLGIYASTNEGQDEFLHRWHVSSEYGGGQVVIKQEAAPGELVENASPQRNQIIRNIDCVIESAGDRTPMFWMLVRDEEPSRAYVQLMKTYKADPRLLLRDLPQRKAEALESIAENLTILLWSDFRELVCGAGWDEESTAVKQDLERRILISTP